MSRIDDPIDALVDSLVMVVLEVLGEDVSQLPYGAETHPRITCVDTRS